MTPLDIVDIRAFPLEQPVSRSRYTLVRVQTQSGLVGWGESLAYSPPALDTLKSAWLNKPAHTYAAITPSTPLAGALDMALLDILGKACKAPVYRVLGGPTRTKVRAFGAPHAAEFPVTHIPVPTPRSRNQGKQYQNEIRALVENLPETRDFILAAAGTLTPGDAASVAATVETKHPLWFDEPCSHSNLEAVRKISGESVVPLGFGLGIHDPGIFQALLREGLIDVVRPEIHHFGITGAKRIAALAETYYVAIAPRHEGGPIATAAALHLAAAIPNFFIQQLPLPVAPEDRAMRAALASPNLETGHDGFLDLPKAPGLGISVNESALEKYHAA